MTAATGGSPRARAARVFALGLALGLAPLAPLAASGRGEPAAAAGAEPAAGVWVLSITQFDYSLLPPGRRLVGESIARGLLEYLDSVSYRLRLAPEMAFYESYAWRRSVQATARALADRQNARSLLLFRGEPGWRYRRDLRRIEEDIERLQEELARREAEAPPVSAEPAFALSAANLNNHFPPPPPPGAERRFAQSQGADGFLAGEVREFHGRFFIRLRLYALFADAFVYEDDVIFSMDDAGGAVEEIAARLTSALSGNPPAQVAVRASPPGAQVLINRGYAGTGEVPARERPPGWVTIALAADGHVPETVELRLYAGELAEVGVGLAPVQTAEVVIDAPGFPGSAVYHGALFVGETPLAMRLPLGSLAYLTLQSPTSETARAVIAAPSSPGETRHFSFALAAPMAGDGRVAGARSRFYWAWAGFWGGLATAWIASGVADGRNMVMGQNVTGDFAAGAQRARAVSAGALILLAPVVGYTVFELSRYLGAANRNVVPVVAPAAAGAGEEP